MLLWRPEPKLTPIPSFGDAIVIVIVNAIVIVIVIVIVSMIMMIIMIITIGIRRHFWLRLPCLPGVRLMPLATA